MKILQVINSLHVGGAEKLIVDLCPIFKDMGCQVDLLLLNGEDTLFKKKVEQQGVHIISCKNKSIYNPLIVFQIIKYMRRYDVIHVHLFPAQYWVAIAKLFSFACVKLITTEHSTSNRRRNLFLFKYVDRFIYQFYHKIICISDETKRELSNYLNKKEVSLVTVHNGINVGSYTLKEKIDRALLCDIDASCFLITQIAGFRLEKDQDTVIRALKYLPEDIHVAFVGDGIRKIECEALIISLGLKRRVHFLGIRGDIPQILAVSDIVVMSSHWEGFGLAAVEGMAAGKPVIASNVKGLSNVVDGAGLLFEHGDEKDLAQKIECLYKSKDEYRKKVQQCIERANNYDISNMAKDYITIYKSII